MKFLGPLVNNSKVEYALLALILAFFIIPMGTLIFLDYQKFMSVKESAFNLFFLLFFP